jgi:hypothetical protein
MIRTIIFCLLPVLLITIGAALPPKDDRYYEMRIYYAAPGKLEDLHARFRNHTTKIFEKHGMTNVGYWVPQENPENKLVYILSYPDKEGRSKAWKAFGSDPEWQNVQKTSEVNGKLVDRVESIFMKATDYSPKITSSVGKTPRVFQLRTYTSVPGKLPNVHARFRDHTTRLFRKHGMTNLGYWEVIPKEGEEANTLIYVLAHPSKEAGEKSFNDFRADPNWQKAKQASEANGPIVEKVEAVYMNATDYSRLR